MMQGFLLAWIAFLEWITVLLSEYGGCTMIFFSRTAHADAQTQQLSAQRLSTRLAFFSLGFATAAWAPLIPYAQQRLNLNHADFGLLLLCTGLGAMLSMPTTGLLIYRLGCRILMAAALLMFMLLLPGLVMGSTALVMAIILFFFGTAAGSLGVAVNFQAVLVEKQSKKPMMSGFHGMGSLGGLVGVMTVTALLALGVSPLVSVVAIIAILALICLFAVPNGIGKTEKEQAHSVNDEQPAPRKKLPAPVILIMGVVCFISFLSEGAAMDWSGIYLTSAYGMNTAFAGLGYTFFAIAMTLGRLFGQNALRAFGENKVIQFSAIFAFIGLMIIVLAPHWTFVLAGYALLGFGSSNIVPVMFSRVGRQNIMQKAAALSCVSTIAYSGSLTGPALIGIIGEYVGLSTVFAGLAFLLISIVMLNRYSQVKA